MSHPVDKIRLSDKEAVEFRMGLIEDEVKELRDALLEDLDIVNGLKEACDVLYVLMGTLVALEGMPDPVDGAFQEVHRSNMSKLGKDGKPIYREDGKVLKPSTYKEPDLEPFIAQPGY